jgi:hypothetical protein
VNRWPAALALLVACVGAGAAEPVKSRVGLVCEAVYLPARTIWVRGVEIAYDQQRVSGVRIDGVPVHGFSVDGTVILTALDNERIQIDVAAQAWQSDFRGQASSQGRCERSR